MACPIVLNGMSLGCKDSVGGIKEIYINSYANKFPNQQIINGVINGLAFTEEFVKYEFRKQTGSFTTTSTSTEDIDIYTTELAVKFSKLEASKIEEIEKLTDTGLVVIVRDNNDKYWFLGYSDYVIVSANKLSSGTAYGDFNGFEISFQDISFKPLYEVNSTTISLLETHKVLTANIPASTAYSFEGDYSGKYDYIYLPDGGVYDDHSTGLCSGNSVGGGEVVFYVESSYFIINSNIYGDVYTTIEDLNIDGNINSIYAPNATSLTLNDNANLSKVYAPNLITGYFVGCALDKFAIESLLDQLVTTGASNGSLNVSGGTNAHKSTWTTDANADYTTLIGRGWTINYTV